LDVMGTIILRLFDPCYSQSPSLTDFTHPYGLIGLKISTAADESGWGLGPVYFISLFNFKSSLVLSLILLYLYIHSYFYHRDNN
jgi:hypothetical protein